MKADKTYKIDVAKARKALATRQPTEGTKAMAQAMSDAHVIAHERSKQLFETHAEELRSLYPGKYAAFVDGKLIVGKTQENIIDEVRRIFPGSDVWSPDFDRNIFDRTGSFYCIKLYNPKARKI